MNLSHWHYEIQEPQTRFQNYTPSAFELISKGDTVYLLSSILQQIHSSKVTNFLDINWLIQCSMQMMGKDYAHTQAKKKNPTILNEIQTCGIFIHDKKVCCIVYKNTQCSLQRNGWKKASKLTTESLTFWKER